MEAHDRVLRQFILDLANTDMAHHTSYASGLIGLLEPGQEAILHEIANVLLLEMQCNYSLVERGPRREYPQHVNQMIVGQWNRQHGAREADVITSKESELGRKLTQEEMLSLQQRMRETE